MRKPVIQSCRHFSQENRTISFCDIHVCILTCKTSYKAEDMILLLLLMNVFGPNDGEACIDRGNLTLTRNDSKWQMNIEISLDSGRHITVNDTAKGLSCKSTDNSCYIECSYQDFFANKNFTAPEYFDICVVNVSKSRADFILGNNISNCTVVDCVIDDITELLESKDRQINIPKDLGNILNIKKMCNEVISNLTLTDAYLRVEKKAIHGVINITSLSKTYSLEDLSLTVVNVNLSTPDTYIQIDAPSVLGSGEPAKAWIPMEMFQNQSQNKIGLITYDSDEIFKLKIPENSKLKSKVIRIEAPGCNTEHLSTNVRMTFILSNDIKPYNETNLSCEYYDEGNRKIWTTDGCNTTLGDNVMCSCNHMTPFAVLLTNKSISEKDWNILSTITYIGCSLSAFFSAVTVFSYVMISNIRAEVSSSIHVSLSGALFLLNVSFMLSEWVATFGANGACVFIAVTIHYSLLSSFTWMAVEALHLYLLLIRVFNIYIRQYMAKLSLIGWGVPALVVGGLMSVYTSVYGSNTVSLLNTNSTKQICWIKDSRIMYGVNLSYFSIVFLFNLGILITVSRQICKLRQLSIKLKKKPVWKDAATVLGLICLLGTTWGLVFFSFGDNNIVISYLFCIFNPLQGFGIFLWMCASARKNREKSPQAISKSTLETSKNL